MREIKFRAWYHESKEMSAPFDLDVVAERGKGQDFKNTAILMEFTGLKDKNRKEIYEGDIVSDEDEISLVEFHEGCFGVHIPSESLNQHECCQAFGEAMAKEYEVVGNIYENPDLIPK